MDKSKRNGLIFLGLAIAIPLLNSIFGWSHHILHPESLPVIQQALQENRSTAILIYIALTIVGCVALAMPGIVFAVAAGVLFGPVWGTIACSVATTVGASLAFLLSRYFLHDLVRPWAMNHSYIRRLFFEQDRQRDIFLLMITRLVPLFPYNLQNFAYGLTDMRFWPFTLYSLVFMLPGTAAYVIMAAGLTEAGKRLQYFSIAGVLLAAVLGMSFLIRRRLLTKPPDQGESHPGESHPGE